MQNSTLKLSIVSALLMTATLGRAQTVYQTVGIIGSATAAGWNASTPMRLVAASNVHVWTVTLPLTASAGASEVKFRANNDWTVNWGAAGFPTGTGVQDGPNIVIATPGTYTVQFNDITGAYQFTAGVLATKAADAATLGLTLAPNPARETLSVGYELPTAATVSLAVQNLLGQTMRQLAAVRQGAGTQQQQLSLQGLAAGIYVVQLQAGTQLHTTRLVVE